VYTRPSQQSLRRSSSPHLVIPQREQTRDPLQGTFSLTETWECNRFHRSQPLCLIIEADDIAYAQLRQRSSVPRRPFSVDVLNTQEPPTAIERPPSRSPSPSRSAEPTPRDIDDAYHIRQSSATDVSIRTALRPSERLRGAAHAVALVGAGQRFIEAKRIVPVDASARQPSPPPMQWPASRAQSPPPAPRLSPPPHPAVRAGVSPCSTH
jgi:hypothetical protein